MNDLSGQSTGRYHILEPLGQGGMAVVYKAYDTSLDITVAIKFIRTERLSPEIAEKSLKRFKSEAQKTAKLMHPNIIPVTDYGDFNGVPFLVMRYIEDGQTLKSMLGKPIPWQEAAKIILPIADALDYAHKNNIVHRDVKPSNILMTKEGIPMLSDFGIAKVVEDEETMDGLTTGGMAIGTPEYMAPEQWEGKKVDGRADIYALGVVFYEMITGRPPFKADTVPATMVQVLRDPLPRPKRFIPNLPDEVESVIFKSLVKNSEDRYSSMRLFSDKLRKLTYEILLSSTRNSISVGRVKDKSGNSSTTDQFILKRNASNESLKPISNDSQTSPIPKKLWKYFIGGIGIIGIIILMIGLGDGWFDKGSEAISTISDISSKLTQPPILVNENIVNTTATEEPKSILTTTAIQPPNTTFSTAMQPSTRSEILGKLTQGVRCRKGPSDLLYGWDITVPPQEIRVINTNTDKTWFLFVTTDNNGQCWTRKEYISSGNDLSKLLVTSAPIINEPIFYGVIFASCYSGFNGNTCKVEPECSRVFYNRDSREYYLSPQTALKNLSIWWGDTARRIDTFAFTKSAVKNNLYSTVICPYTYDGNIYTLAP